MAGKNYIYIHSYIEGFSGGSEVKNPPANAGNMGSIPESGRSPGLEMATHFNILAGKSHGPRSLVGYSSWGHKRVVHNLAINKNTHI